MWRWVAQAEIDGGEAPGVTIEENEEIRRLRAENLGCLRTWRSALKVASRRHPGGLAERVQ